MNLIPGSSAFSIFSLYIWTFSGHVLLNPSFKDFEHYLASMWNKHSCAAVWTFFGIAFFGIGMKTNLFLVLRPPLSFPDLLKDVTLVKIVFLLFFAVLGCQVEMWKLLKEHCCIQVPAYVCWRNSWQPPATAFWSLNPSWSRTFSIWGIRLSDSLPFWKGRACTYPGRKILQCFGNPASRSSQSAF